MKIKINMEFSRIILEEKKPPLIKHGFTFYNESSYGQLKHPKRCSLFLDKNNMPGREDRDTQHILRGSIYKDERDITRVQQGYLIGPKEYDEEYALAVLFDPLITSIKMKLIPGKAKVMPFGNCLLLLKNNTHVEFRWEEKPYFLTSQELENNVCVSILNSNLTDATSHFYYRRKK